MHTLHALMQLGLVREYTWAIGAESIACVLGKVSSASCEVDDCEGKTSESDDFYVVAGQA